MDQDDPLTLAREAAVQVLLSRHGYRLEPVKDGYCIRDHFGRILDDEGTAPLRLDTCEYLALGWSPARVHSDVLEAVAKRKASEKGKRVSASDRRSASEIICTLALALLGAGMARPEAVEIAARYYADGCSESEAVARTLRAGQSTDY